MDKERGGRGGTGRQGNQYRKGGDRVAMRRETTDPTYSFAFEDMIIGDL